MPNQPDPQINQVIDALRMINNTLANIANYLSKIASKP